MIMNSKQMNDNWRFSKPPAKEATEIRKKAETMRSGKAKSGPLADVIKKLEKIK